MAKGVSSISDLLTPLLSVSGVKMAEKDTFSNVTDAVGSIASQLGPAGMLVGAGLKVLGTVNQAAGKTSNASWTQNEDTGAYSKQISPNANKKFTALETIFGKKLKNTNKLTEAADYHNALASIAVAANKNAQISATNSFQTVDNKNKTALIGGLDSRIIMAKKGTLLSKNSLKNIKNKVKSRLNNLEKPLKSAKEEQVFNVIPEGALHSRLNKYEGELGDKVTTKGIPVVCYEEGDKIVQHAEIENSEIEKPKRKTTKQKEGSYPKPTLEEIENYAKLDEFGWLPI
jgi:hypothetical protein